jgi:hypothetical protein
VSEMVQLIERREGPYGEVALRRRGECFEIVANGCFLMDSSDGRSERLLVSAGQGPVAERDRDGGGERPPGDQAAGYLPRRVNGHRADRAGADIVQELGVTQRDA